VLRFHPRWHANARDDTASPAPTATIASSSIATRRMDDRPFAFTQRDCGLQHRCQQELPTLLKRVESWCSSCQDIAGQIPHLAPSTVAPEQDVRIRLLHTRYPKISTRRCHAAAMFLLNLPQRPVTEGVSRLLLPTQYGFTKWLTHLARSRYPTRPSRGIRRCIGKLLWSVHRSRQPSNLVYSSKRTHPLPVADGSVLTCPFQQRHVNSWPGLTTIFCLPTAARPGR